QPGRTVPATSSGENLPVVGLRASHARDIPVAEPAGAGLPRHRRRHVPRATWTRRGGGPAALTRQLRPAGTHWPAGAYACLDAAPALEDHERAGGGPHRAVPPTPSHQHRRTSTVPPAPSHHPLPTNHGSRRPVTSP